MRQDRVVVVIHCQALSGQADVAKRELSALIGEVLEKEGDCLSIEMHQDQDDPTKFMMYEHWRTREAYTGPHMQTPYIQAFFGRAAGFMAGPPAITFWNIIDVPRR